MVTRRTPDISRSSHQVNVVPSLEYVFSLQAIWSGNTSVHRTQFMRGETVVRGTGVGTVPDWGLLLGGGWITIVGRESSTRTLTIVVGVRTGVGNMGVSARPKSPGCSIRTMIDTGVGAAETMAVGTGAGVGVARLPPSH